jgi:hypothetical protein
MRKSLISILAIVFIFMFTVPVLAGPQGWLGNLSSATTKVFSAVSGQKTLKLYVNEVEIKPDVPPFIDNNNRTMVPLRFAAEALGCIVDWDAETQTVKVNRGDTDITLIVGLNKAKVNDNTVTMDTKAVIKGQRTMVPLRFIGESLNAKVEWVPEEYAVYITDDEISGSQSPKPVEEQPVDEGETYKLNGFTVPKDTDLKIDSGMERHQLEISMMLFIDKPNLEKQYQDAYDIVASKFGDAVAQEVIDYVKQKDDIGDKLVDKWWTVNGQEIAVGAPAGWTNVNIHIWAPGA